MQIVLKIKPLMRLFIRRSEERGAGCGEHKGVLDRKRKAGNFARPHNESQLKYWPSKSFSALLGETPAIATDHFVPVLSSLHFTMSFAISLIMSGKLAI